jgi:hypothetical protein
MRKLALFFSILYSSSLFGCGHDKYIGFELGHTVVNYMDTAPSKNHIHQVSERKTKINHMSHMSHMSHFWNVYFGQRLNKVLTLEMGFYSHLPILKSKKGKTASSGVHTSFLFPIKISKDASELLLGVGVAHSFIHAKEPNVFEFKEHTIVPRVTIAHQYQVNDRLKIRTGAVFIPITDWHGSIIATSNSHYVSIGLNYSFDMS